MATKSTLSGTNLPEEIVTSIFNKVKGHSSLAKLGGQMAVPFSGTDIFTFSLDGEVAIVGEGQNKPAGEATIAPITIKPIKIVYQHRVTDEFLRATEERSLNILQEFGAGFAKKIASGLDIMAMHGVNPADLQASTQIGDNHFDTVSSVTEAKGKPEEALTSAVGAIGEYDASGFIMSKTMATELGTIKVNGVAQYPEFMFGAKPDSLRGNALDINSTVTKGNDKALAYVGDFANAFRWGYAANIPMEVIQYGDPDGLGDLKRTNEVVLRAEAWVGWGILDKGAFSRVVSSAS